MEKIAQVYRCWKQYCMANMGLFALLIVVFVIYAPGFKGELVVDDVYILKGNPYIDHGHIARFFSSGFWDNTVNQGDSTPMYRPLVLIYFWLLHKLWGGYPTGYHISLTLLHLANISLVYFAARRLFVASAMGATMGAAIFALHPARVESVAWISGIPDPLVTFFLLGALLAHQAFSENRKNWWYLALAACCFQLALWCKEVAVIFPLIAVAYDLIVRRKINWLSIALYGALVAGYFVVRSIALGEAGLWSNVNMTHFSRAFDLALGYGELLVFPAQVPFYLQPPQHQIPSILGWGAAVLIVSLIVVAWRMSAPEKRGLLAFSMVWMAGFSWTAILMMFYLEGFYSARFLYVPAVGLAFFTALFYDRCALCAKLKIPVIIAGSVMVAAYGMITLKEIPMWHDDVTVYQRINKLEPEGTVGFVNLGFKLMDSGNYAKAEENFLVALKNAKIPKVRAEVLVALGTIAGMNNDIFNSARYLNEAVRVDPHNPMAWAGLGNLAWMGGQPYEAIPLYEKSLAIRPQNYEAAMNLASVYEQTGQAERAAAIRNAARK